MNYTPYAEVLEEFVDERGRVDYEALKENREKLDTFIALLEKVDPAALSENSREERMAFWINAYNAITLRVVIDHYPIKSGFFASLLYPKNSIRRIPGAWDELWFKVAGASHTLDHIEHVILRPEFREPRVHMALVCASVGCPILRKEPYKGEVLDSQLDEQTKAFLARDDGYKLDRKESSLRLSEIFKWFALDFLNAKSPDSVDGTLESYSKSERGVLRFLVSYIPSEDISFITESNPEITYSDYDWSLNEQ